MPSEAPGLSQSWRPSLPKLASGRHALLDDWMTPCLNSAAAPWHQSEVPTWEDLVDVVHSLTVEARGLVMIIHNVTAAYEANLTIINTLEARLKAYEGVDRRHVGVQVNRGRRNKSTQCDPLGTTGAEDIENCHTALVPTQGIENCTPHRSRVGHGADAGGSVLDQEAEAGWLRLPPAPPFAPDVSDYAAGHNLLLGLVRDLGNRLTEETESRIAAVAGVAQRLAEETESRIAAVAGVAQRLAEETESRMEADADCAQWCTAEVESRMAADARVAWIGVVEEGVVHSRLVSAQPVVTWGWQ